MRDIDVTAMGELLIDFACKSMDDAGYPTLAANPGGAPGNFLAALSSYGCSTAMIGKVGADKFGDLLVGTLKQRGIETCGVVQDPKVFTTLAFVTLDETGNREFSFARKPGADTKLRYEEIDRSLIKDCRVFHFGTLSMTTEPARTATIKAVEYAHRMGRLVSFDPNLRLPLWADPEDAKKAMLWGLGQADIIKMSDEEVEFLWGITPEQAAPMLIKSYSAGMVYITLGPKGCYFANMRGHGVVASPEGIHVVDTTGAGDIFGGSAMSEFIKLHRHVDNVEPEEAAKLVQYACTAASLATQSYGGISSIVPEAEVRAHLQDAKILSVEHDKF